MRNAVEHSVIEQEFSSLKSLRQILAKRLFDHAWPRKTNHCAWLGENCVSEHCVTRADAARRRIREDRDVRQSALGELREHRSYFRHLHEREHAFLHARSA